jgi:hypothetical protein
MKTGRSIAIATVLVLAGCISHSALAIAGCVGGHYKFIVDRIDRAQPEWKIGTRIDLDGTFMAIGPSCARGKMEFSETADGATLVASSHCTDRDKVVTVNGHVAMPACDVLSATVRVEGHKRIALQAHLLKCEDDPEVTPDAIRDAVRALNPDEMREAWSNPEAFAALV